MSTQQFERIGTKTPARAKFDLRHELKTTGDMGYIYPIFKKICMPGSVWNIGVNAIIRMQPLVAPVLHRIDVKIEYFFVPLRLITYQEGELDEKAWTDFITGGDDGDDTTTLDTWTPTGAYSDAGSLWDYFGFPITATPGTPFVPTGTIPLAFPLYAYNKIWNEWYRAEHIQTERTYNDMSLALRNWEKDYFTAALPWQELGDAVAIDLVASAEWVQSSGAGSQYVFYYDDGDSRPDTAGTVATLNNNTVSSAVDVHDLRLAYQIQKWKELNARAGVRYTEYLQAYFDVHPEDSRLQRSEYLGGTQMPLVISEVLNQSAITEFDSDDVITPQGDMSGHGITGGNDFICKYRAEEWGIILGLLSIIPEPLYQQGIPRELLYESRYDWPNPLFVGLSEQEIYQAEIFATHNNQSENETIFGYIGRYDEHRVMHSLVTGGMRSDFDHWHISRQFAAAPTLNDSFLQCSPRKDIFAVPSEDGFIISIGNDITAIQPIPAMNVPGNMT